MKCNIFSRSITTGSFGRASGESALGESAFYFYIQPPCLALSLLLTVWDWNKAVLLGTTNHTDLSFVLNAPTSHSFSILALDVGH